MSYLTSKLLDHLSSPFCKSHSLTLESVISLVLAVEQPFSPHCDGFLPLLIDLISGGGNEK